MRKLLILTLLVAAIVAVAIALRLPDSYAEHRLAQGLARAGMPGARADCMARYAVSRLSFSQLRRLSSLESVTDNQLSADEKLAALRRAGDARVVEVMARSAALCTTGLAR